MSETELPQCFESAQFLAEQIETYLGTPIDLAEDTADDKLQRDMRAMALLRQSCETLKAVVRSAVQSKDSPPNENLVNDIAAHFKQDHELDCPDGECTSLLGAAFDALRDRNKQALAEPSSPVTPRNE